MGFAKSRKFSDSVISRLHGTVAGTPAPHQQAGGQQACGAGSGLVEVAEGAAFAGKQDADGVGRVSRAASGGKASSVARVVWWMVMSPSG